MSARFLASRLSIRPVLWPLLLSAAVLIGGSALNAAAQDSVTPRVKQIYKFDCAICHGDNGNGKTDTATSLNLTIDDWTIPSTLAGKKDQELFDVIRKGTPDSKMPPEADDRAKDAEVHGLIAYIRGFSKGAPSAPTQIQAAPATSPQKR